MADCELLEDMYDDLEYFETHVSGGNGLWAPEGLIQAHENIHLALYRESIATNYAEMVCAIKAITLPCSDYDAASAKEAMQKDINSALGDWLDAFLSDQANNAKHVPLERFLTAQKKVLKPWFDLLDIAAVKSGCWM